jgi:hypothetical protein
MKKTNCCLQKNCAETDSAHGLQRDYMVVCQYQDRHCQKRRTIRREWKSPYHHCEVCCTKPVFIRAIVNNAYLLRRTEMPPQRGIAHPNESNRILKLGRPEVQWRMSQVFPSNLGIFSAIWATKNSLDDINYRKILNFGIALWGVKTF